MLRIFCLNDMCISLEKRDFNEPVWVTRGKPCNKLSKNDVSPHMVFADRLQSGEVFYLKLPIKISVTHTSVLEINHSLYSKAGVWW